MRRAQIPEAQPAGHDHENERDDHGDSKPDTPRGRGGGRESDPALRRIDDASGRHGTGGIGALPEDL
jgi:hypothetical protein